SCFTGMTIQENNLSNIYKDSIDPHYFQMTYKQLEVIPDLDHGSLVLLPFLLGAAQTKGKPSFVLTTAYLIERTRLTRKTLSAPKSQLEEKGLVSVEPAKGKGAYRFTFPVVYRYIDLETLTSDELRSYFMQYLYDAVESDDGIMTSTCPFHGKNKQFTV